MKHLAYLIAITLVTVSCKQTANNNLTQPPPPATEKKPDLTQNCWRLVRHFEGNSPDTTVDPTERVQITDSTFILERDGKIVIKDTLVETCYLPNTPKHHYFELKSKHSNYKVRFPDDYSFMYCNINGNDGIRRIYKKCN